MFFFFFDKWDINVFHDSILTLKFKIAVLSPNSLRTSSKSNHKEIWGTIYQMEQSQDLQEITPRTCYINCNS